MQCAELGTTVPEEAPLARGDLVFWKGHVGIMLDPTRFLHSNGHHMATVIEPLAEARGRIAEAGEGAVLRIARLDEAAERG
jgi:cell wall-associated NlpC family hydrolase